MSAIIDRTVFEQAVADVLRFPRSSALAGSELIFMRVQSAGKSSLSMYGGLTVHAFRSAPATGSVEWIAVDGRALAPFSRLAQEDIQIVTDVKAGRIIFKSGIQDLAVSYMAGQDAPKMVEAEDVGDVTQANAEALRYLAALVPDEQTRPDLAGITIIRGAGEGKHFYGIACNQQTVAKVLLDGFTAPAVLSVILARELHAGDKIQATEGHSKLISGQAIYAAPLPEEYKMFPLDGCKKLLAGKRKTIGSCDGTEFQKTCEACKECLGFITKLGAYVEIVPGKGKLLFRARSGSARFRTSIDADIKTKDEVKIYLPIEEASTLAPLCAGQTLTFAVGDVNSELFLSSDKMQIVVAGKSGE